MRSLVIEPTIFYQLLADREFYEVLPPSLAPLRDESEAARLDALNVALGKTSCTGCTSISSVLLPLMNQYGRELVAIQAVNPAALEPLVAYITKKRGFRPTPIVMYHKDVNGKTLRLVL